MELSVLKRSTMPCRSLGSVAPSILQMEYFILQNSPRMVMMRCDLEKISTCARRPSSRGGDG